MNKILAAIDVVLNLLGALIATEKTKERRDDYTLVSELLTQLKTLGESGLGRLLQQMNYVREVLNYRALPSFEDFKRFLDKVAPQIIDCDADPFIPKGWSVEKHYKNGQMKWDPARIQLYLSEEQKQGRVQGCKLYKKLKELFRPKNILNANVLDFLLAHTELIPEEWKDKCIFFWGTTYKDDEGILCVRYLLWNAWSCRWIDIDYWDSERPAAILVS